MFQVSGFKFQVSGFRFLVSGFDGADVLDGYLCEDVVFLAHLHFQNDICRSVQKAFCRFVSCRAKPEPLCIVARRGPAFLWLNF